MKPIHKLKRILRLLYDLALSIFVRPKILKTWENSAINRINKDGAIIDCPYCGSSKSDKIFTWKIDDHFGLFDSDISRLRTIYGQDVPLKVPRQFISLYHKILLHYRKMVLQWISERSFVDYRRCNTCDLVFQNYPHTASSAARYYQAFYRLLLETEHSETDTSVYGRDNDRWVGQQQLIGQYFVNATQLSKGSKVVDIGCAEGLVCRYLTEKGIIAYGLEPSQPMAGYANLILGLDNIVCDSYSIAAYPEAFFDGIITHHVAEHVVEITGFFNALSTHLKVGGFLLLQVPCMDNIKDPADYRKTLQGGHIYCFSEIFLINILIARHFEILECKKTPCDLKDLGPALISPYETSIWADDPGGISILARKRDAGANEDGR